MLQITSLSFLILFVSSMLAITAGLFLYFRSGRRELFERNMLFDFAFWAAVGALIGGRIFDFLIQSDFYNWSVTKLLFFNVFSGFDFWGALAGSIIVGAIFLKRGNENKLWKIFDLLAAPIVIGASIVLIGSFASSRKPEYGLLSIGYLVIFWILKRLERTRRHAGFFICLTAIAISLLNLIIYPVGDHGRLFFGRLQYDLVIPVLFAFSFGLLWLFISKTNVRSYSRRVSAQTLLGIFKLKRIVTSVAEANNLARAIIILPLSLSKLGYNLVSLLGREIYQSFVDLVHAFGIRK